MGPTMRPVRNRARIKIPTKIVILIEQPLLAAMALLRSLHPVIAFHLFALEAAKHLIQPVEGSYGA